MGSAERQNSSQIDAGLTGQTENCQAAVYAAYVTVAGWALINFVLRLGWAYGLVESPEIGRSRRACRLTWCRSPDSRW